MHSGLIDAIRPLACQAIFDQITNFPDGGFDNVFLGGKAAGVFELCIQA